MVGMKSYFEAKGGEKIFFAKKRRH